MGITSGRRSLLLTAVKLVVSIGLMAVLFSRVDAARLWHTARGASPFWILTAIALYLGMLAASAWRWGLLLNAQGIVLRFRTLMSSFLVATFFNNFLPSNIGGDVVRVTDTAPVAGSKTLAATIVLIDRGIGLLGLFLIAALGATTGPRLIDQGPGVGAVTLWAGFATASVLAATAVLIPKALPRLLSPLRIVHPEWVDERLGRLRNALDRFRRTPAALVWCFAGAVLVQGALVAFYLAVARSMHIPVGIGELAFIVPVSFIIQMMPISLNGLGVREATFGFYFARLGLPLESALLVSFVGAGLVLVVSLIGGVTYLLRSSSVGQTAALLDTPEGQPYP
jgi:glycosyltransferase 2 family protein